MERARLAQQGAEATSRLLDRPVSPQGNVGIKYDFDPSSGQVGATMGKVEDNLLNTPFESAADPAALGKQMAQKFNDDAAAKAFTPQQAARPVMDQAAALGQAMSGNPFGAAASALQGSAEGDKAFLQNKQDAWPATASYVSQMTRPTGTALDKETANRLKMKEMEERLKQNIFDYSKSPEGIAQAALSSGRLSSPEDMANFNRSLQLYSPRGGSIHSGVGGAPVPPAGAGATQQGPPLETLAGPPIPADAVPPIELTPEEKLIQGFPGVRLRDMDITKPENFIETLRTNYGDPAVQKHIDSIAQYLTAKDKDQFQNLMYPNNWLQRRSIQFNPFLSSGGVNYEMPEDEQKRRKIWGSPNATDRHREFIREALKNKMLWPYQQPF